MANKGYVNTLLNKLPSEQKTSLVPAFEYVLDNWRLGGAEDGQRAENAQWYRFDTNTAAVANEEFSIRHGLNQRPSHLMHALDLTSSGGQLVNLKVTRPADAARIYLSSPTTNAFITVWAEV